MKCDDLPRQQRTDNVTRSPEDGRRGSWRASPLTVTARPERSNNERLEARRFLLLPHGESNAALYARRGKALERLLIVRLISDADIRPTFSLRHPVVYILSFNQGSLFFLHAGLDLASLRAPISKCLPQIWSRGELLSSDTPPPHPTPPSVWGVRSAASVNEPGSLSLVVCRRPGRSTHKWILTPLFGLWMCVPEGAARRRSHRPCRCLTLHSGPPVDFLSGTI